MQTLTERKRYKELKEKCKSAWIDFATAILEIRERKLYLVEYSTFEAFCMEELQLTHTTAKRLMAGARVLQNLSTAPMGAVPNSERQARPLSKLEPELQRETWAEIVQENQPEKITAKIISEKVAEKKELNQALKEVKKENQPDTIFVQTPLTEKEILKRAKEIKKKRKPHVLHNSGENEWYTPSIYIEAARKAMGSIDLDPASSEVANKVVKATKYYTKEQNGLNQEWIGNIWLNPPYSQPLINNFSKKIIQELPRINSIIILVNNATETKWFQRIMVACSCICFVKSRIKFLDPHGNPIGAPLQGQSIIYIGKDTLNFIEQFSKHGVCLLKEEK